MKKIFLSFILSIFFISSVTVSAQNFVPRYVNTMVGTTTPTLQAGSDLDLEIIVENSNLPEDKTNIEYGVVRRIVQGTTISYEPISILKIDKSYSSSKTQKIKVKVPNVLRSNASTTYVVYAKTTVVDDVDAENFIVSKQYFKIQGNEDIPTTKIEYMNFLHSNGKRYGLLSGPSIYDLSKTTYKGVASSTSLDIVLRSNTDLVLNPNITFKKLRSDVSISDFKPAPINILKGTSTVVVIPLPVFDYDPGVYQGTIDFDNKDILNVDFQYIINGDIVTFGQPVYSKTKENNQILDFKIYGTPIDTNLDPVLNNISTSTFATSSIVYGTEFIVKDKNNKELYRTNQNIDFSTTTYKLEIPANIKNIAKVSIKTTNADGKVLYEGTKDLNIPKDNTLRSILLVILFVLVIVLILIFKHKYVRVILLVIAMTILGFWVSTAKAGVWGLPFNAYLYQQDGDTTYVAGSWAVANFGFLFQFNTNIVYEPYYTDEDVLITYQSIHEYCDNWVENLYTSFSFYPGYINDNNNLHITTNLRQVAWGQIQKMNYPNYLSANPWYLAYIQKHNMTSSNFSKDKAMIIFKNEFKDKTGIDFDLMIAAACPDDLCGREEIYISQYIDELDMSSYGTEIRDLWNATNIYHFANNGWLNNCFDELNCATSGSAEYVIGSGARRIIVTRWVTENFGLPPSKTPIVYARRVVQGLHYSDIRYAIPLLNVIDRNNLSVTVDNITKDSARVNWNYENTKPQTNYQVELSTSDTFSTIIQNKSYSPVTVNTFDKYLTKINNLLSIKPVSAATTVDLVRDVTFDGLLASTTYYVRVRVQNSDGWGNYVPASFKTLADNNTNALCICSGRDKVCVQNGITSTTTNAATCKLMASCGVVNSGTNTIFTIIPTNLLGNASYVQTSGVTATAVGGVFTATKTASVQSIAVTIIDSQDGQTASASCSIDNTLPPLPPLPPGDPFDLPIYDPTLPRVIINKTPIISLNSGGDCKIDWILENIPATVSCVLTSTDGTPDRILTESGSQTFGPLTSNQRYTVTCTGAPLLQPLSVSTVCRVNGEVRER
jgi:hypothetical protein